MNYAALIPLFPLVGFVIVALFGKKIKNEKVVGTIASSAIAVPVIRTMQIRRCAGIWCASGSATAGGRFIWADG